MISSGNNIISPRVMQGYALGADSRCGCGSSTLLHDPSQILPVGAHYWVRQVGKLTSPWPLVSFDKKQQTSSIANVRSWSMYPSLSGPFSRCEASHYAEGSALGRLEDLVQCTTGDITLIL